MAYKGKLKRGKQLTIEYKNDSTSIGAALVMLHWAPPPGGPPLKEDVTEAVDIGRTTVVFDKPVPAGAGRLKIEIDVTDGAGFGLLTVKKDGGGDDVGAFTEDDQWSYLVVS